MLSCGGCGHLRRHSCGARFVDDHDAPEAAGEVSFERAGGVSGGLPLDYLLVVVGAACAGRHTDLDPRDGVGRGVQLPVAVTGQPMPRGIGARDLHGCGAGVVRVRGSRGEPARRAGAAQQAGSQDPSHAVDVTQPTAVLIEQRRQFRGVGLKLLMKTPDVSNELLGQLHPDPVWAGARAESTQRSGGADRGRRGWCAAGHQIAQQHV